MKVVLDTNVLLAALAARGLCEAVYEACLAEHQIVLSDHILKELRRNLRAKLKVSPQQADEIVAIVRENASVVEPVEVDADACGDPDDHPVLGTLLAGEVNYLVTGDQDLLVLKEFRSVPVLSPRAFYDRLK